MSAVKQAAASSLAGGDAKHSGIVTVFTHLGLLILAAFLFAFSFPSGISTWGLFPLGYIALVPLFIVVHRSGWIGIFLYGLFYGVLSYTIFNFWLLRFHPLAIFIVPVIYGVYFFMILPVLKLGDSLFPDYGYLVQLLIWIGYEYLKTTGFLGYAYGIMGYTQYLVLPLIRISSVTGVWGVSLLVVFPSVFFGNALKEGAGKAKLFIRRHRMELFAYTGLFIFVFIFGFVTKSSFETSPQIRVALIQHNVDPWKSDYEESLDLLISLSREAVKEAPDMVVWSETAFVPAIDYHTRYRTDKEAFRLVKRLKDFLGTQEVPYVLGNDDGVLKRLGGTERIDYNAALLWKDGEFVRVYRKLHLVPFTENFPYEKQLPGIYNWLKQADTHFWEPGDEYTVFEALGVKFSTPICFEDTFGYLSRNFIRAGADLIVNISNDSWANSVTSEMQHMSMAVFRAVENKRTVVRSTNGGITCTIDPNGRITSILDPFIQGYLVSDVPVYNKQVTLYTKWGDWFGIGAVYAGLVMLALGGILGIMRRRKED